MNVATSVTYGGNVHGDETNFRVWAPRARTLAVEIVGEDPRPMRREGEDFVLSLPARAGDRYFYRIDDGPAVPDPVSRLLPRGVHGPTEIVDPAAFPWQDRGWRGRPLTDFVIYELHIGTFTSAGTFDAAILKLPYLKELGITALEIMPVAAFPGARNWGYDGASPYAVQATHGGPDGFRRLVDSAHSLGLAILLDVVYNHLGPEGNYLPQFGPYFTEKHRTPWGEAINYDQPGCQGVRRFILENAEYWIREYHLDGLRLDAVQTIRDHSARPIVAEISDRLHALGSELGRTICVIAETDENDSKYLRPAPSGFGLDAIWSDDFHHSVHAHLTAERQGYYQDFGERNQIVRALAHGFVFQGEPFRFWGTARGTSAEGIPLYRHVICTQNHDQVGNRAQGERITALMPRGARKLIAALLVLAPHTPLLFMGQEYDEDAPFQFFTDYGDPVLRQAVTKGRREEFQDFTWEDVPDPQDAETFARSKLRWEIDDPAHRDMLEWYRTLLHLRRERVIPSDRTCRALLRGGSILLELPAAHPKLMVVAEFPDSDRAERVAPGREWRQALMASEDGYTVAVYCR